jgi:barstar (barnase inhibitor)
VHVGQLKQTTNSVTGHKSTVGVYVANVRGSRSVTTGGLFQEFAAAFHFPTYFGYNWSALDECLADLSWLRAEAYVLNITQASLLLSRESSEERQLFAKVLCRIANEWKNPKSPGKTWEHGSIAFHAVLDDTSGSIESLLADFDASGCEVDRSNEPLLIGPEVS